MKKSSKIIISCATLSQGGASRVVANLSKPFADEFDSVTIILWVKKPVFYTHTDPRVTVLFLEDEAGSKNDIKKMLWFRKYVKQNKPDMILSFLEPFNIRVLLSTIGLGVNTIVAERNDPRMVNGSRLMDWFEKTVYKLADAILVQTQTVKEFFTGPLESKVSIIYNPVNIEPEMVGKALRTEKKKRIVSAARLTPQKHLEDLINAFAIFVKTHNDYTLTLYGEGPQEAELKMLVNTLGISNSVEFPGPSKTIHDDILNADMFVLVSDREGMSNSMIEAMCLGLPCICTKVSGAIDLIRNRENGLLIDVGDIDSLVECMTFIADNPAKAEEIGRNAANLYSILNKDLIYKQWVDYVKK